MPNHCYNKLTVKKGVDLILEALHGKKAFSDNVVDITFNKLINMDKDVNNPKYQNARHLESLCENNNFDWYSWSCEHWGTKWDAYNTKITHYKNCCVFEFTTAWCPPVPVINELVRRFKDDISFTFSFIVEGEEKYYTYYHTKKKDDFVCCNEDKYKNKKQYRYEVV